MDKHSVTRRLTQIRRALRSTALYGALGVFGILSVGSSSNCILHTVTSEMLMGSARALNDIDSRYGYLQDILDQCKADSKACFTLEALKASSETRTDLYRQGDALRRKETVVPNQESTPLSQDERDQMDALYKYGGIASEISDIQDEGQSSEKIGCAPIFPDVKAIFAASGIQIAPMFRVTNVLLNSGEKKTFTEWTPVVDPQVFKPQLDQLFDMAPKKPKNTQFYNMFQDWANGDVNLLKDRLMRYTMRQIEILLGPDSHINVQDLWDKFGRETGQSSEKIWTEFYDKGLANNKSESQMSNLVAGLTKIKTGLRVGQVKDPANAIDAQTETAIDAVIDKLSHLRLDSCGPISATQSFPPNAKVTYSYIPYTENHPVPKQNTKSPAAPGTPSTPGWSQKTAP